MSRKSAWFFWSVMILAGIYNFILPLHPDEAYYWVWSRRLQLSYYDHPPMVAYLIKLTTLLGTNEFAIRLVALISIGLAAFLLYKLSNDLFNQEVAEKGVIIFLLMPLVQSGLIVVTPDSPLVLFWTSTLYFAYQYLKRGEKRFIYLTGLTAGLLLLSKYTGVLLLASLFLYLLFSSDRKIFKQMEFYLAILLVILLFSLVLIWNYQQDWVSFKFQYAHGVAQEKIFNWGYLGEFLGGQALVFNPIFFLGLFFMLGKNIKELINNKKLQFLSWPFLFTFIFFLYQAFFNESEANWPGPAYITAAILLAYWINKYSLKKFFYSGLVLGLLLLMIIRVPELIPAFPPEAVLKSQFMGYDQIFSEASEYLAGDLPVISDSYQNASEVSFYLKGRPEVYIITPTRFSNYNYWSREFKEKLAEGKIGRALYIGEKDQKNELLKYFQKVNLEKKIVFENKYIRREYYVYLCSQ